MSARTLTRTQAIEVDVDTYVRTHGRAPRRSQYGAWIFEIDGASIELTGEFLDVKRRLAGEGVGGVYVLQP